MPVLAASAFLTFLGFLVAGLLALAVTALLDRKIGKERALPALVLAAPPVRPVAVQPRVRSAERRAGIGQDGARGARMTWPETRSPGRRSPAAADGRNPFRKHSDTRPLPPVALKLPPWFPLPFELPPTVPGPAPAARRLLRGDPPALKTGDGTTIPEIPAPVFSDYTPVPDDLYDGVMTAGARPTSCIRRHQDQGDKTYLDGDPQYDALKRVLVRRGPGWDALEGDAAFFATEEQAARRLSPTDFLRSKGENRASAQPAQFERWFLRASVDNLYHETSSAPRPRPRPASTTDIADLRARRPRWPRSAAPGRSSGPGGAAPRSCWSWPDPGPRPCRPGPEGGDPRGARGRGLRRPARRARGAPRARRVRAREPRPARAVARPGQGPPASARPARGVAPVLRGRAGPVGPEPRRRGSGRGTP